MTWTDYKRKYTQLELQALLAQIECTERLNNPQSIMRYDAKTSKKLDAIAFAINDYIRDHKKAAGTLSPVADYGYSGRQSNRR